jgi:hypothetical protein
MSYALRLRRQKEKKYHNPGEGQCRRGKGIFGEQ